MGGSGVDLEEDIDLCEPCCRVCRVLSTKTLGLRRLVLLTLHSSRLLGSYADLRSTVRMKESKFFQTWASNVVGFTARNNEKRMYPTARVCHGRRKGIVSRAPQKTSILCLLPARLLCGARSEIASSSTRWLELSSWATRMGVLSREVWVAAEEGRKIRNGSDPHDLFRRSERIHTRTPEGGGTEDRGSQIAPPPSLASASPWLLIPRFFTQQSLKFDRTFSY